MTPYRKTPFSRLNASHLESTNWVRTLTAPHQELDNFGQIAVNKQHRSVLFDARKRGGNQSWTVTLEEPGVSLRNRTMAI
jgi:hypothetical protein